MFYNRVKQLVLQKTRHLLYVIWARLFSHTVKAADQISIDVIIPAIERDLITLPLCIQGLRKNVRHTIKDIYLVSPDKQAIKEFAVKHRVIFLDETTVLGYTPKDFNYVITSGPFKGLDRSGWIFQQLVKLSGKIGTCRYCLAIDADHVLLQPHTFINEKGATVFYQSSEYNQPYYNNIKKLLKRYPVSLFSYVSHKMLFDKEQLKALHQAIEVNSAAKLPWDKVILASLNTEEVSGFSEFELYGNFVKKESKMLVPWNEKMLGQQFLTEFNTLQLLNPTYLSVTFPSYLNTGVA